MRTIELNDNIIRNNLKNGPGIRKWNGCSLAGFGMYEEDELCGWIIASIDKASKTADVESFWVKEDLRGNGYGEKLFTDLMDYLKEKKVEAAMVSLLLPKDAHAAGFFIRKGFYDCEEEYPVYRLAAAGLRAFVEEERKRQDVGKGRVLRTRTDASEEGWMEGGSVVTIMALEELSDKEKLDVMDGPAKAFLRFGQAPIDPHFSLAVFKDSKVTAVILIRRHTGKTVLSRRNADSAQTKGDTWEIAWMGSTESAAMSDVMHLVWRTMCRLADGLPEEDEIFTAAVVNSTANMIEKFFAGEKWKKELSISHVMRYVRIYEHDNVLKYYFDGAGI